MLSAMLLVHPIVAFYMSPQFHRLFQADCNRNQHICRCLGCCWCYCFGAELKVPGTRAIHLNTLSSLVMHNSSAMPHRNSKRQMPHIIVNWYFFFWLRSYLSCSTYQTFAHLLSSFLWSILQSMYAWYPANKLNCNRSILASVRYSYWICIQRNHLIIGSIEIENAIG